MRVVVQRVSHASVTADGEMTGTIGTGMLVLVGFTQGDGPEQVAWMADKLVGLRIFRDDDDRMNRDVVEAGGAILVVSQFTLYGDASRGRRPSFVAALAPREAEALYDDFVARLAASGVRTETGRFGAMMSVELANDGPVTLVIER